MYQVITRDGELVDFNIEKIRGAILKAFKAKDKEYTDDTIDFLALKVTADFNEKIKNGKIAVEDVQDSVERVLQRAGYEDVAKA
jgi:ribonucleoside-triphosphate reductase